MNILVIKNPYKSQPFGGGEAHTMAVMEHLRNRGHQISFVGSCHYLLEEAEAKKFPVTRIDWAGKEAVSEAAVLKFLFTKFAIKKHWESFLTNWQKKNKIDLLYVLSWNEKFLLRPIAKKLGLKTVFVEHVLQERFIQKNPWRHNYIEYANAATTIAVSQAVKQSVIKTGVNPASIKVIYNGINTTAWESQLRKNRKSFNIGTTSRLCDQKGLDYLVTAVSEISSQFPDLKLKIVGQGEAEGKLKQQVKSLGLTDKIEFLGSLEHKELGGFLEELDVFAYTPVWGEAFGLAVAEAGFMRLPSVATDVGGVPEVVVNKETGLIVPPRDSDALAKSLAKLLNDTDLRLQMGEAAYKRITQKFTKKRMLDELANIIENT